MSSDTGPLPTATVSVYRLKKCTVVPRVIDPCNGQESHIDAEYLRNRDVTTSVESSHYAGEQALRLQRDPVELSQFVIIIVVYAVSVNCVSELCQCRRIVRKYQE